MKPKISVVIPCYNAGLFIEETIKSVETQTIAGQTEIIIVNDGSSDENTLEVLKMLSSKGYNIINQENMGLSEARNSGVKKALGEYILCLDADDIIRPTFLEKTSKILDADKTEKVGIAATWIECFGSSDEIWKPLSYDPTFLLISNILSVGSLFRKKAWEVAGGYKEGMNSSTAKGRQGGYEDWEFWISIVEKNYRWEVIEEPLLLYRRLPNSMIASSRKKHNELFERIVDFHTDFYRENFKEVILKSMEKINYLQEQLSEREQNELKFFGIGSSAVRRVLKNPQKLLELRSYKRVLRRILKIK